MRILIVGDVYSKLGRASFERNVKRIKAQQTINFVIVNGENTSHGNGLNEGHYKWYMEQGVNVVTLGNHSFGNRSIFNFIDSVDNVVRPYNLKEGTRGRGYATVRYNQLSITVMQMIGTVFMNSEAESPFLKTTELLDALTSDIIICDFHGEATSEKIAYGYAFDGKITVIYGTHTHVQTNDARILDRGTAYITDVGMTGALDGVIGVKKEIILDRYLGGGQQKFSPADTGRSQFSAVIVEINETTHKATGIDTIRLIE